MPATCVFCGGSPTTKEHLISKWISAHILADPRGLDNLSPKGNIPTRIGGTKNGEPTETIEFEHKIINIEVSCACKPCNEGWMSRIETAAQPYLKPMIRGESVHLDENGKRAVAAWAALKAIVSTYMSIPGPVDQEWLDWIYATHEAPTQWRIWLARYTGRQVAFHESINVVNPQLMDGSRSSSPQGVLFTLLIGSLLIKVLGTHRNDTNIHPDEAIRISPHQFGGVDWPPNHSFGDAEVALFFEFNTGRRSPIRDNFPTH